MLPIDVAYDRYGRLVTKQRPTLIISADLKRTLILIGLSALGPISTDLYLASLPDIGRYFSADIEKVQMTLSVFLWGFALPMLIYGPLSDRFGRRPVVLIGLCIFVVGSVACFLSTSIEMLIASRFLQAVGACSGPVLARAIVRDVYPHEQAAKVMSYMASAMALAPLTAPILGGWVHAWFGWRINFVLIALIGFLSLIGVWQGLEETNRRPDIDALAPLRMANNYRILLTDLRVLRCVLLVVCAFSGMFCFISGSSFILIGVFHLPPFYFGFGFATAVAGYMAGGFVSGRGVGRGVEVERMMGLGAVGMALSGGICCALSWSGIQNMPALLLPLMGFFFFSAMVIPNSSISAVSLHPRMAGAASACLGFLQMTAASFAGWAHSLAFDHTTRPLAALIGIFGAVALFTHKVFRPQS